MNPHQADKLNSWNFWSFSMNSACLCRVYFRPFSFSKACCWKGKASFVPCWNTWDVWWCTGLTSQILFERCKKYLSDLHQSVKCLENTMISLRSCSEHRNQCIQNVFDSTWRCCSTNTARTASIGDVPSSLTLPFIVCAPHLTMTIPFGSNRSHSFVIQAFNNHRAIFSNSRYGVCCEWSPWC